VTHRRSCRSCGRQFLGVTWHAWHACCRHVGFGGPIMEDQDSEEGGAPREGEDMGLSDEESEDGVSWAEDEARAVPALPCSHSPAGLLHPQPPQSRAAAAGQPPYHPGSSPLVWLPIVVLEPVAGLAGLWIRAPVRSRQLRGAPPLRRSSCR